MNNFWLDLFLAVLSVAALFLMFRHVHQWSAWVVDSQEMLPGGRVHYYRHRICEECGERQDGEDIQYAREVI